MKTFDQKLAIYNESKKKKKTNLSEARRLHLSLAEYSMILKDPDPIRRAKALSRARPRRKGKAAYCPVGGIRPYVSPRFTRPQLELVIRSLEQTYTDPLVQAQHMRPGTTRHMLSVMLMRLRDFLRKRFKADFKH